VLKLPVAVVAPLTSANALVAVGVVVFSEWRSMDMPMTFGGALLICGGATLVSLAK
jgi:hypothetical protein